jgi:hypothetical protein
MPCTWRYIEVPLEVALVLLPLLLPAGVDEQSSPPMKGPVAPFASVVIDDPAQCYDTRLLRTPGLVASDISLVGFCPCLPRRRVAGSAPTGLRGRKSGFGAKAVNYGT